MKQAEAEPKQPNPREVLVKDSNSSNRPLPDEMPGLARMTLEFPDLIAALKQRKCRVTGSLLFNANC